MGTYLSTVAATRAHKTWLAYNLILNEFRKSCTKEYLDQIEKSDLTAFVVALRRRVTMTAPSRTAYKRQTHRIVISFFVSVPANHSTAVTIVGSCPSDVIDNCWQEQL
jgi:hypothetical protein